MAFHIWNFDENYICLCSVKIRIAHIQFLRSGSSSIVNIPAYFEQKTVYQLMFLDALKKGKHQLWESITTFTTLKWRARTHTHTLIFLCHSCPHVQHIYALMIHYLLNWRMKRRESCNRVRTLKYCIWIICT